MNMSIEIAIKYTRMNPKLSHKNLKNLSLSSYVIRIHKNEIRIEDKMLINYIISDWVSLWNYCCYRVTGSLIVGSLKLIPHKTTYVYTEPDK